ncbi:MAG: c-type cytochrome [Acidimicrobiales bacterium]
MTEIPEHLLARSRERRAAMGGSEGAPGGPAEPSAPVPASTAEATGPAPGAAAVPAVPDEPATPEPVAPYVQAALTRKKMPYWIVPVLVVLPIWGIFYVGTLERRAEQAAGLLAEGEEVYSSSCAACHGANGQGGVGYKLDDGEVLLTFPDTIEGAAAQIAWVADGSPSSPSGYGSSDRPGGQRVSTSGMPGWGASLTAEELLAVVHYERVVHGGMDAAAAEEQELLFEAYIASGVELSTTETPEGIAEALSAVG